MAFALGDGARALTFDIAALRRRASSRDIAEWRDGDEIVWCGDQDGDYVGWTTRENADAKGYAVVRTDEDPATLAFIEVAEAAHTFMAQHGPIDEWENASEEHLRLEEALTNFDFKSVGG